MDSLQILQTELLSAFLQAVDFDPLERLEELIQEQLPVDSFQFYNAVSSVYSSKIEGEEIEFDSFYKHKFLNVPYQPDYTKRSDDLFKAYEFIYEHPLTADNVLKAHRFISENLLPASQRGVIRNNPMFVINEEDRIEYVACDPFKVREEWDRLFLDIANLKDKALKPVEVFFYASMIHLIFLKIHPLQDGNGRTARLMEKWFLMVKLGEKAASIDLEKNYFLHKPAYYQNIRVLGLEYEGLDYSKALPFLQMTINRLKGEK